jgi:hypothetical protein
MILYYRTQYYMTLLSEKILDTVSRVEIEEHHQELLLFLIRNILPRSPSGSLRNMDTLNGLLLGDKSRIK